MKDQRFPKTKELESLLDKGWEIHETKWDSGNVTESLGHPTLCPIKRGVGFTRLCNALETQTQEEFRAAGKNYYYLIRCNLGLGYGYNITELRPDKSRNLVMNVTTEESGKIYISILNEKGNCEEVKFWNATQYPYILVLKEKYGDRYFHVPTLEIMLKTCYAIVMDRIEDDYWYADILHTESPPEKPDVSKEDMEKWKDGLLKHSAKQMWSHYEEQLEYFEKAKREQEELKFIQANNNAKGWLKAYWFLRSRRDGEYEGVKFESMENIFEKVDEPI